MVLGRQSHSQSGITDGVSMRALEPWSSAQLVQPSFRNMPAGMLMVHVMSMPGHPDRHCISKVAHDDAAFTKTRLLASIRIAQNSALVYTQKA